MATSMNALAYEPIVKYDGKGAAFEVLWDIRNQLKATGQAPQLAKMQNNTIFADPSVSDLVTKVVNSYTHFRTKKLK